MKGSLEFIVDGESYFVTKYSCQRALPLLAKLLKIVGEPLGNMISETGAEKSFLDSDISGKAIGLAVKSLASNVDADYFPVLIKEILQGCEKIENGKKRQVLLDPDFTGKIFHLFKVLAEVLKFQYFDSFFDQVAAVTQDAPATVKTVAR